MEIPAGMRQEGVVVGGGGIKIEAFIAEEIKDPKRKVVVQDGNAYIFGPAEKK